MKEREFHLPLQYAASDFTPIDLSISNDSLHFVDASSSDSWERFIQDYLKQQQKKVAFGGYLEHRNLYQRSAYFNNASEDRCIHLGVDFWAPAQEPICAVLSGRVHSFHNNTNFGDYGPTIILEHSFAGNTLYSLYGHLSEKSLEGLFVGKQVEGGEVIAWLGDSSINGDYAPHLHLQLIRDLQGNFGDYPGVCTEAEKEIYALNCPNPLKYLPI